MSRDIEQGTIKIAWLEDNPQHMGSKVFDSVEDAEAFAIETNKKDYLIFKLIAQKDMGAFPWGLLPYGRLGLSKRLFGIYKKGLLQKLIR